MSEESTKTPRQARKALKNKDDSQEIKAMWPSMVLSVHDPYRVDVQQKHIGQGEANLTGGVIALCPVTMTLVRRDKLAGKLKVARKLGSGVY